MRRYSKVFLIALLVFASLFVATAVARASDDSGGDGGGIIGDASGSGGDCAFTGTGTVDEVVERLQNTCTSGTVDVYQNFGPSDSGEENVCTYGLVGTYDCATNSFSEWGDWENDYGGAVFVDAPCNFNNTRYHSCEINKWTGKLVCGFWKWNLAVQAGLPCATLDIEPYPVTLVRWPTYLRFSGAGSSSASARIDFVGRGTAKHPLPGDQKNIRLVLSVHPLAPQMQVYLPRAGYYQGDGEHCTEVQTFTLPLQNSISPPRTVICWNVPSHPAAGAGPLAGTIPGMDELASDFPLFVGWARVPYMAEWHVYYDEWDVVKKTCEAGPRYDKDGNPVYECATSGSTWKNGHWVKIYDWKGHTKGGVIDPAAVEGMPQSLLADLNHDGRPDGFWSYSVRIRRMDETWNVHNPVYHREWPCRSHVYFAVREGQTQSIYYPNTSP